MLPSWYNFGARKGAMKKKARPTEARDVEKELRATKRMETQSRLREDVQSRTARRTQVDLAAYHTPNGELIDVAKAAEVLSLTKRRVRSFILDGRLVAVKINKLYLIKYTDLMEFGTQSRRSGRPKQS
jgi:excisionase family DNA binding protein